MIIKEAKLFDVKGVLMLVKGEFLMLLNEDLSENDKENTKDELLQTGYKDVIEKPVTI